MAGTPPTIPIQHHVYSSSGETATHSRSAGYQTLHASGPFAGAPIRRHLEEWAKRWCRRQPQSPMWFSFPAPFAPDSPFWLLCKVFQAGADHAGRPRTCVHTIGVQRAAFPAHWQDFNPARIPEAWFLSEDANLDHVERHLLSEAPLPPSALGTTSGTVAAPSLLPTEGRLAQWLLYVPAGAFMLPGRSVPDDLVRVLDWLPLPYRLRWAVVAESLEAETAPRQLVLSVPSARTTQTVSPQVLAEGWPVRLSPPSFPTGLWDHWVFDPRVCQASRGVWRFRHWVSTLALAKPPEPESEDWLLLAYQCLQPCLAVVHPAQWRIDPSLARQVALGILALGWGNHAGTATALYAQIARQLTIGGQIGSVAEITHFLWHTTTRQPGPALADDKSGEKQTARQLRIRSLASPHALVMQTLWNVVAGLEGQPCKLGIYRDPDFPLPDLRTTAKPWLGADRSLLWFNLAFAATEAIRAAHREFDTLPVDAHQRAIVMLGGQIAQFLAFRERVAGQHQWIFASMTEPGGTVDQMRDLLDRLEAQGVSPDTIQKTRDRLTRITAKRKS